METIFFWLLTAGYLCTGILYFRSFTRQDVTYKSGSLALDITVALHVLALVVFTIEYGRIPVATLAETLSTSVCVTALCYRLVEWRLRDSSMGTFIAPLFFLLQALASGMYSPVQVVEPILEDITFEVHVLAMLIGYGAFIVSGISSLLFLLLDRELEKGEPGVFFQRLQSLPYFYRLTMGSVRIGVFFGAIGLGVGLYFANELWSDFIQDPKVVATFVVLSLYVLVLLGRSQLQLSERSVVAVCAVATIALLFAYTVLSLVGPTKHDFSSISSILQVV